MIKFDICPCGTPFQSAAEREARRLAIAQMPQPPTWPACQMCGEEPPDIVIEQLLNGPPPPSLCPDCGLERDRSKLAPGSLSYCACPDKMALRRGCGWTPIEEAK